MQFTWTFPQFIVSPISNGMDNVVTAINWVCTGTDGMSTSSASGTAKLSTPNPAEFVPYANITQDMAYAWVSSCISMPAVESGIAMQITQLSHPVSQPQVAPF